MAMRTFLRPTTWVAAMLFGTLFAGDPAIAAAGEREGSAGAASRTENAKKGAGRVDPALVDDLARSCSRLDDPQQRRRMDGLLYKLIQLCGRQDLLDGATRKAEPETAVPAAEKPGQTPTRRSRATDARVNDPSGDTAPVGQSHTQGETAMARNEISGTLCAGYNDSYHALTANEGFSGFSRSLSAGANWFDQGPLGPDALGDPSLVWRKSDGHFYYAALHTNGLGLWKSIDDCASFSFVGMIHSGISDDKELMAVDNDPASPHYGKLYVVWTNFDTGQIFATHSANGGAAWSTPVALSVNGDPVQGAWPTVAAGGTVYASWLRWQSFPAGPLDIQVAKSTNGGVSWTLVAQPMTGGTVPRDSAATADCSRDALNGKIRYLPSPQIAAGPGGVLHVVYSRDPDGIDNGDVIDVFYRRSTDGGTSWGTEVKLNDDATTRDQFFPSLALGTENAVSVSWYDRRLDPNNLLIDRYQRLSYDGGVTWQASTRLSDVSSPVRIDPELATCYHGDYDQHLMTPTDAVVIWSDDRSVQSSHNDADVFTDLVEVSNDFLVTATGFSSVICRPATSSWSVRVRQFAGFSESVTLAPVGWPSGLTASFGTNPVTPPGFSSLDIFGTSVLAFGNHDLLVRGTSSPSGIQRHANLILTVYTQLPAAPAPSSPANAAGNQDLFPTLEWAPATEAADYRVEVATDAAFANIVQSANVIETRWRVPVALAEVTTYFWRVRASNQCGTGSYGTTFSFTTRKVPDILLVDDDDNIPNVRPTYEAALAALGLTYDVYDTANSDTEPSTEMLGLYGTVIWFTGHEFGGAAGPGAPASGRLATWLDTTKGCFFLSSQDYYYDRGATSFGSNYLGLQSATDTMQTTVTGAGAFAGLGPYTLNYSFGNFTDSLVTAPGGSVAFQGNLAPIGLSKIGSGWRTVFFAFPLEGIPNTTQRHDVLRRTLQFCMRPFFSDGFETGNTSAWSQTVP